MQLAARSKWSVLKGLFRHSFISALASKAWTSGSSTTVSGTKLKSSGGATGTCIPT